MPADHNHRRNARCTVWRAPVAISLVAAIFAGSALAGPLEDAMTAYAVGDYATALPIFRQLGDSGVGRAQAYLGALYESGRGVPQDYAEAAKWLRKAADQGLPGAQYALGLMYEKGSGVARSYVDAHMWISVAASRYTEQDAVVRDEAKKDRDRLESMMTPSEIAEAQKRAIEWKSE